MLYDEFYAPHPPLAKGLTDSAVDVKPAERIHYHYEDMWFIVEQITGLKIPPRDIQSNHVESLIGLTRVFAFDYRNEMMAMTWSGERKLTDYSMQDAIS